MITRKPEPGSFSDEVEQFLEATAAGSCSQDMRNSAPRLDRRLCVLDRERSAIVTALLEAPTGSRKLASALLRRIRALVKADNKVALDCYWHDLGGEGGA